MIYGKRKYGKASIANSGDASVSPVENVPVLPAEDSVAKPAENSTTPDIGVIPSLPVGDSGANMVQPNIDMEGGDAKNNVEDKPVGSIIDSGGVQGGETSGTIEQILGGDDKPEFEELNFGSPAENVAAPVPTEEKDNMALDKKENSVNGVNPTLAPKENMNIQQGVGSNVGSSTIAINPGPNPVGNANANIPYIDEGNAVVVNPEQKPGENTKENTSIPSETDSANPAINNINTSNSHPPKNGEEGSEEEYEEEYEEYEEYEEEEVETKKNVDSVVNAVPEAKK
ncbi:MAG: hypothetical protein LBP39_03025 [Rickettsiales bacterium]|jgi:hypothetical protein|nr:hypothetical protein [Rickettsiales bacterium]